MLAECVFKYLNQTIFFSQARLEHRRQLEAAFAMFDVDKSGTISKFEMKGVLCAMGYNPNEDQLDLLMLQVIHFFRIWNG